MLNLTKSIFFLILSVFILLSGCTHVRTKDGPPNFYVDETKIPNAKPRYEKLSRIGNKDSYTVFGKRYYVMKTSRNYEERGIASWYGTKFHSRHTSNGERYNMLSMTAAHKTLPLPTYVQVTNLKNGKQVIVKVNDRGPFESNRLIDLSYVAAKKLGMIGHGTTYVDVRSIDPRDQGPNFNFLARNDKTNSDSSIHNFLPPKSYAQTYTKSHHAYVPKQYASNNSFKKYSRIKYDNHSLKNSKQFTIAKKTNQGSKASKQFALTKKSAVNRTSFKTTKLPGHPFKEASAKKTGKRLSALKTSNGQVSEAFDITGEL